MNNCSHLSGQFMSERLNDEGRRAFLCPHISHACGINFYGETNTGSTVYHWALFTRMFTKIISAKIFLFILFSYKDIKYEMRGLQCLNSCDFQLLVQCQTIFRQKFIGAKYFRALNK